MAKKSLKKQIEERKRKASELDKLADVLGEGSHKLRKGDSSVDFYCHHGDGYGGDCSYRSLIVNYKGIGVLSTSGPKIKKYSPGDWEEPYKKLLSSPQSIAAGKRNHNAYTERLKLEERAKEMGL